MKYPLFNVFLLIGIGAWGFSVPDRESLPAPEETSRIRAEILRPEQVEPRQILRRCRELLKDYALDQDVSQAARAYIMLESLLERRHQSELTEQWDAYSAHTGTSVRSVMSGCFFSWREALYLYRRFVEMGWADEALTSAVRSYVADDFQPMERGPNNRSLNYAVACAYAAACFPDLPKSVSLRRYAEAVWDDWYQTGGSYEPGYVGHHLPQIIELGLALGRHEELRSLNALKMFYRYRDHVSPSGRVFQQGDGEFEEHYIEGLKMAAEVTGDPTLLWASMQAFRSAYGPAEAEAGLARYFSDIKALEPQMPDSKCTVQNLFESDYKVPDRMILNPSRRPGSPYAAVYLCDRTNATFHGHEDTRGEIYHYEVDGTVYLKHEGWVKWTACHNSFTVVDARDEFPFNYTKGLTSGHWYRASANLRIMRDYIATERWKRDPGRRHGIGQTAFTDGNGFAWTNPDALRGQCESIELNTVTLRFVAIPRDEWPRVQRDHLRELSFDAGLFWYRDYREIATVEAPYGILISELFLAGPKGKKVLFDLDAIPDDLEVLYYPPGTDGKERLPARTLSREEIAEVLRVEFDPQLERKVLRLTCRLGRTDLIFGGLKEKFHVTEDYQRIGFRYKFADEASRFLRAPLRIEVNGECPRSMYPDNQQGGVLTDCRVQMKGDDCFGSVSYEGVYTYDSAWRRSMVLTREGVLVVRDIFMPGREAEGLAGGPVWHVDQPPTQGLNWFDSVVDREKGRNLMIYFHPTAGHEYGVQFQPKLWEKNHGYGVFEKAYYRAQKPVTYLTVMVPHSSDIPAATMSGKRHYHMKVYDQYSSKGGILTKVEPDGRCEIEIRPADARWPHRPLRMVLDTSTGWSVSRQ